MIEKEGGGGGDYSLALQSLSSLSKFSKLKGNKLLELVKKVPLPPKQLPFQIDLCIETFQNGYFTIHSCFFALIQTYYRSKSYN